MYPAGQAHAGISTLLRPQSIAVFGASARKVASGNEVISNLRRHQYAGELHVVHPSAREVDGLRAVPRASDLPGPIDLALVSLPGPAVVSVLEELDAVGCRTALVPTAGMDARDEDRLRQFVAGSRMVVHGPNCMGVLNVTDDIPLWFYDGMLTEEKPGNVALVTQSGSAAIFVVRSVEQARFSRVVSTGSELGLTTENYLDWLCDDPATEVVALVIESIKDVGAFTDATARLRAAGKPIVVLKVGRSAAGKRATVAHTGALVGRDEAYEAFFERLDVPLVNDYDELAAAVELLSRSEFRRPMGNRVGVVTISGGQAALAADLARGRVELPALAPSTSAALAVAQPGSIVQNPFDAGASLAPAEDGYRQAISALAEDSELDTVLVLLDAQGSQNSAEVDYSIDMFADVRLAAQAAVNPIVVASSSSVSTHPRCREALGSQVPLLRGISNAMVALRAAAANRKPVVTGGQRPGYLPDLHHVAVLKERIRAADPVSAGLVRQVLTAYGIPMVESLVVPETGEAFAWAAGRYPVVVKTAAPEIAHRSDIGAVVLDVKDHGALRAAMRQIASAVSGAHPAVSTDSFELQRQVPPGAQAMIGFVTDPIFGATVSVGSGGTLVELDGDSAVAAAPLSPAEAAALLSRTRLGALLGGYRNLFAVTSLDPLADLVHRFSWLAVDLSELLVEADLNPAIVQPGSGQVLVVDALLVGATRGSAVASEEAFA